MVKGLSRRVVVVKPAGSRFFEQAIFILRDSVKGVDEEALLQEACASAEDYVRRSCRARARLKIPAPAFAAAGAAVTAAAWLVTLIK